MQYVPLVSSIPVVQLITSKVQGKNRRKSEVGEYWAGACDNNSQAQKIFLVYSYEYMYIQPC